MFLNDCRGFKSCLLSHTCRIQEQTLHGMKEQLYEFAQCTLQVLNVSTVRHTAHIQPVVKFLPYSVQHVWCDSIIVQNYMVLR
jgi:hypothetical protein